MLESRLAPKGAGGGLAAMIPAGMRAVAMRVNEVVGVAGFVVPGMRVDILISGSPPNSKNADLGSLTKTLLQNIEVLSAGQDFKKDAEGKPISVQVVNVLVTPEQAEQLSLAASQTTIQLVLRNPLDQADIQDDRRRAGAPVHRAEVGRRRQANPEPPASANPPGAGDDGAPARRRGCKEPPPKAALRDGDHLRGPSACRDQVRRDVPGDK